MNYLHGTFSVILLLIVLFSTAFPASSPDQLSVGFFAPTGVDEFIYRTDFSMMNACLRIDPETGRLVINRSQLIPHVQALKGLKHKLNIDLGAVICDIRSPAKIHRTYTSEKGKIRTKVFKPLFPNKLRDIVDDEEIESRLKGFTAFIKEHRDNIGVIFLADEPYLNGISKHELERALRKIRSMFERDGMNDIEFGVIFASGMFNAKFAKHIQKAMESYVMQIDDYYNRYKDLVRKHSDEARAFKKWVAVMKQSRLTTYDVCGNMYTGGGLPEGLHVVAFDFYLSTLLLDNIHRTTLNYYADMKNNKSCNYFHKKTTGDIQKELSFFGNKAKGKKDKALLYQKDRHILDMIFSCRMATTVDLLRDEVSRQKKSGLKIMLIGESSANGLLEFRADGSPKSDQPGKVIEQRMLDETKRTFEYYEKNTDIFNGGLMFFLYPDSYDKSIDLFVMGAKSTKNVTEYIYNKRNLSYKKYTENQPPVLTSLGNYTHDDNYALSQSQASAHKGQWYINPDQIIAFDPDGGSISYAAKSTNDDVIAAKITPDGRLALKYNGAYGKAIISVTVTDEKDLSDTKSFTIAVSPDE